MLKGDSLLVMTRICEHPTESIEQRCQILQMDRAREFRARSELHTRGLIDQVQQMVAGKIRFFQPTKKGLAWAEQNHIRVKKFKSGIIHEYLLTQIERKIGLSDSSLKLQRNSSIAHNWGLQPDLLVLKRDGTRIIVEICCTNVVYDAKNILAEIQIPEIDMVIAITPNKQTKRALEKAIKNCLASSQKGKEINVKIFDASQCLLEQFDWKPQLNGKE